MTFGTTDASSDLKPRPSAAMRVRWFRIIVALLTFAMLAAAVAPGALAAGQPDQPDGAAGAFMRRAVRAIGGQDALVGLERLEITATGASWIRYEAPQPDGLMETTTYTRTYTFDLADEKLRVDVERQLLFEAFQFLPPQTFSIVLDGNVGGITAGAGFAPPGNIPSSAVAAMSKEQRFFNPHFLLREALAEPGLVGDGGTVLYNGRPHRILTIDDDVAEIRLFIDQRSGLISRLETMENNPLVRDTRVEVLYQDWQARGSLMFPNRVELHVGGAKVWEETRTSVELEPSLPAGQFDLPPGTDPNFFDAEDFAFGEQSHHVVEGFFALGFFFDPQPGLAPPVVLAPGLTLLATGANTLVVDVDGGQVVIEAPFSPTHGTDIVDAVGLLSSDPITHIVQSHHHVDHASGVRSLVAAGATVVVGNGTGGFWDDILDAESTIRPDALAGAGVTGVVEELDFEGTFVIADDDITMTVYHVPANPHADGNLITTIETMGQVFLYQADLYNAGFGFTLVIGGQAALFDAMRDLGIIDGECNSALPLTIVPAHGFPTTLEASLAELADIGVNVGC
jgi:glyoxylase-like metal-dependent hydrolase (beta-lactamase superfamily II)